MRDTLANLKASGRPSSCFSYKHVYGNFFPFVLCFNFVYMYPCALGHPSIKFGGLLLSSSSLLLHVFFYAHACSISAETPLQKKNVFKDVSSFTEGRDFVQFIYRVMLYSGIL